jgi:hypothetical protein
MLNEDTKCIYVPYAVCLWSTISKVESFQKIMKEVCRIISFNNNFTEETIRNYRHCELLHLFIFLSNITKPPSYTRLNLNLRNINLI